MRQGEILNLQWQDVDFARGTLIVMKSKNGTRRTIPLNTKVFDLLAAKQSTSGGSRGPVFKTPLGMSFRCGTRGESFVRLAIELPFQTFVSTICGIRSPPGSSSGESIVATASRPQDER